MNSSLFPKKKAYVKKSKRKVSKKPSKNLVKVIQKVIDKNCEDKETFGYVQNVYYNSGINSSADCLAVITTQVVGPADNQRIGDQIRMTSHTLTGCLQLSSPTTSIASVRIAVRLFVVQPKQYNNAADAVAAGGAWTSYLLEKGGTTSGFNGNLQDLWAPVNTDAITVYYDKIFYLNTAYQTAGAQATSTTMGDSIKFFKINLTRRQKLLKFDASVDSGLTPTNYAPILLLGYCKLDGSSPDLVSTIVSLSYDNSVKYQDA